jgi:hypothetical protein
MQISFFLIIFYIFCSLDFINAQNTQNQFDNIQNNLVPNPAFQITGNEQKFNQLLNKMGLNNIMMQISLEKYKDKLLIINKVDFRKIDAWDLWVNFDPTHQYKKYTKELDMYGFYALLDLNKRDCIGSFLAEGLEKDATYEILFQFYPTQNIQEIENEEKPCIAFCFLNQSPQTTTEEIIPQKEFIFQPNQELEKRKKRKKVIESLKKEYGTQFESKEWKEFAGEDEKPYQQISFQYKAKGGEKYILIGNFDAENNDNKNTCQIILKNLSIKKLNHYNTKTD